MYRNDDQDRKVERRVLKDAVTREDVIQHAIAARWTALGTQERTDTKPFQYLWRTFARDAHIFYIEEARLGYAFLEAESADAEALAQTIGGIDSDSERVPVFTDAEVFAASDTARTAEEKIGAVYLTSLSSPKSFDPDWMPPYERAAQDADASVRLASLYAMSQADWPEFRPLVRRLADDPDHAVRTTAAHLRQIFDRKFEPVTALSI